jgi:hypothetical protein
MFPYSLIQFGSDERVVDEAHRVVIASSSSIHASTRRTSSEGSLLR